MGALTGAVIPGRLTPQVAVLLIAATIAWTAIIASSQLGGAMAGILELDVVRFLVAWTLMVAAMMLPSVAPVASLYSRSTSERHAQRLTLFTAGYLVVWAAAGVLVLAMGALVAGPTRMDPSIATDAGVGAYLVCGLYQLSPLKYHFLSDCRRQSALSFEEGSDRGALRDFRVGAHHGASCLGCCWALMVVLLALGAMSVVPMLVLSAVIITEKLGSTGKNFSSFVGIISLALAIASIWIPDLAPGFHAA